MPWVYPPNFNATTAINYANFVQQAYFQYYILAGTPPVFGYPPFSKFMQLPPSGYTLRYNIWYNEGIFTWDPVYFGYVAASPAGDIIIAIRGTENSTEWTDDILFSTQTNSPIAGVPGKVHLGFATIYNGGTPGGTTGLNYYAPTNPIVPPKKTDTTFPLAKVLSGARSVNVTGHSLGAALATLLILDIAVNVKMTVTSYNFASPMVGDPTFANFFNGLIGKQIANNFRVANGVDPIPTQPSNVYYAPGSDQEWNYMQVNGYCPVDSGLLSVIGDPHSLSNYVIGLKNLLSVAEAAVPEPTRQQKAGLQSIPDWRKKVSEEGEKAA